MSSHRKQSFIYRKNFGNALSLVKKMGVRSIHDIISDPNSTMNYKVNYIRHHYVYYEGNYDLFHDENGKANSTKLLLDKVIREIIRGNADPVVLTDFNKEVIKLRKQRDLENQKKIEEEISNDSMLGGLPRYKLDIIKAGGSIHGSECTPYLNLIDQYINQLEPEMKQKYFFTKSYKEMKKLAVEWNKNVRGIEIQKPKPPEPKKEDSFKSLLKGYEKYAKKQGWN